MAKWRNCTWKSKSTAVFTWCSLYLNKIQFFNFCHIFLQEMKDSSFTPSKVPREGKRAPKSSGPCRGYHVSLGNCSFYSTMFSSPHSPPHPFFHLFIFLCKSFSVSVPHLALWRALSDQRRIPLTTAFIDSPSNGSKPVDSDCPRIKKLP